jgi:regulator of sirC expression with transglutaminase-like and TPR domain
VSRAFRHSPHFRRLLDGAPDVPLEALAIELAQDAYPELDPAPLLARIDELARRARERCRPDSPARARLGQINWVLYVEEGFRGNTDDYYDARNSYLNDVLDRRLGIPISLGVLYAAVASRVGLTLRGVNLPAHFMLRVEDDAGPIFVDAFLDGDLLDAEGCRRRIADITGGRVDLGPDGLAPCEPAEVLGRMLRNLKSIYLGQGDLQAVLPVQRRLAALRPDDPAEQRDWALLASQLDRPGEAVEALRRTLHVVPEGPEAEALRQWLKRVARDHAERN